MSHIDELIKKHCPDGVEFRAIQEVARILRGVRVTKRDLLVDGKYPVVSGGTGYMGYIDNWNRESETITIAQYGTAGYVNWQVQRFWANDVCFSVIPKEGLIDNRYLYYVLLNKQQYLYEISNRNAVPYSIEREKILSTRIPVPHIEVQQEVVMVLDTFSKLKAELEAELEARRVQYTHYRSTIVDELERTAPLEALASVGTWYGGGTPSKSRYDYWNQGTIPWVSPKDMGGIEIVETEDHITEAAIKGSATKLVPATSIVMVVRSSILDKVFPSAIARIPVTLNQDMKAVVPRSGLLPDYLTQVIRCRGDQILKQARRSGGSVASIETAKLMAFKIPVPALDDQRRVAEMLGRLDALANDLRIGLPAELKARRKQYEYYRDRLLTFQEAT